MKVLSVFLIVLGLITTSFVWSPTIESPQNDNEQTGIHFQDISFQQALKKAEKEGKLIFLDAYTSWCGPCKMLAKTTFKDEKVAAVFNKNFINIHIDMEKGEGPAIARKYKVRAYPTLILIDSEGKQVKRMLGYRKSDRLLSEVAPYVK